MQNIKFTNIIGSFRLNFSSGLFKKKEKNMANKNKLMNKFPKIKKRGRSNKKEKKIFSFKLLKLFIQIDFLNILIGCGGRI